MRAIAFFLRYFEEIVAGTFMSIMTVTTVMNVLARYIFNSPIQWAEELSRYSFIWLVFVGAALCSKRKKHIVIDSMLMVMPVRARLVLRTVVDVAVVGLMIVIMYYSWVLIGAATHPTAELKIPQYVVYMAVPISAALVLLHTLHDIKGGVQDFLAGGERA